VTEAARELEDGVGDALLNCEKMASVDTKTELTIFQVAACELLRLPCTVQSSTDGSCSTYGQVCLEPEDCCSEVCYTIPSCLVPVIPRTRSKNWRKSLRSVNLKIVVCGVHA
jgi:hypothetical protein